jgi:hypothetical protein
MSMYCGVKRTSRLGPQMIYGSALSKTTVVKAGTQKAEIHMNCYTMKHIEIWEIQGRGKDNLNLVREKHISEID